MSNNMKATREIKSQDLTPKLRFPEFRDTGKWEEKSLGKIATFTKGKGISKADISSNGLQACIRYGELYTQYKETISLVVSYTNISPDKLVLSRANDVIIPASGETQIDIATASCVLESGIALGGDLNIIRSKMNGVFLSYYLNSAKKTAIAKMAQGNSVVHLYSSQLKTLKINVPKTTEQQKIADCLSSIDEVIVAQAQKFDVLKSHKKGLMQQLFPAEGETVPKLRFPEFRIAPEWDEKSLGTQATKIGSGITPTGGEKTYKTEGHPFIRSQNIGWGCLILDNVAFIDDAVHSKFNATEIQEDDVFLNISGASIGRSAVADSRVQGGNVNQHVCIIRTKKTELNPYFLNQYLLSQYGQKQIDSFQAGGNRQGLNFSQIRSFVLPIPLPEEQRQIARCLSSIDELIAAQAQKFDALKTHKKGLMQQLFPFANEVNG